MLILGHNHGRYLGMGISSLTVENNTKPSIMESLLNKRMLLCIFTGFSSGLPLYVLIQLLQVWLDDNQVDIQKIALLSLAGLPYVFKFLWAPLLDRYVIMPLGRRRSWMLPLHLACAICIAGFGLINPSTSLLFVGIMGFSLAFFSASLDIVLDAYRRELLPDNELGLGNSIHVQAYRIAGLVPGSLALILADIMPWQSVFLIVGAFMIPGIFITLMISEPETDTVIERSTDIVATYKEPFVDFFSRHGVQQALLILVFMLLYKMGDSMATALSSKFYLDLGFSKTEIGVIAKNAALWPSIIGGFLGGILMLKIGINKALWLFGAVQIVSILGFVVLAEAGPIVWLLAVVIAFEYLGVGLGTAAFTAFIARSTSRQFAAAQLALLTAMTGLPRTVVNASTGVMVDGLGWTNFFIVCVLVAIPGMLLLFKVAPWSQD